jgi:hypothetical protein
MNLQAREQTAETVTLTEAEFKSRIGDIIRQVHTLGGDELINKSIPDYCCVDRP